jgi:hypothetical protein
MVAASKNDSKSQEVASADISEDAIVAINTFEDALALFANTGGVASIGNVAGDGYAIVDKELLLNIPLLILDWKDITDPDTLNEYVTIRLITSDGRKCRISDGSTGIAAQLDEIGRRTGILAGIAVPHGLTKSEYFVDDTTKRPIPKNELDTFTGKKSKAATYYLSTSA